MGRPASNWLAHLETYEDAATSPPKVERALIDARYARSCDEWWDDHKSPEGDWRNKAIKNYKSASATFWEAYEDETTPHIYQALWAAAKAATARAAELEDKDKDGNTCNCDVCRAEWPSRPASNWPVYNPPYWGYGYGY